MQNFFDNLLYFINMNLYSKIIFIINDIEMKSQLFFKL